MSPAELVRYVETLTVTQGAGAGDRIRVLPWQRRFIRGAFEVDGDAALSVARGAGKSTLTAGVAAAALDGPLRQSRAEVVCVASSFNQGRIVFEHVSAFMRERGHDLTKRKRWRLQDTANLATIECRETGARVRCIGSDPKRAHGLAPLLVLADEPAQWERTKAEGMLAALRTSMGKIPGSRLIALGTRPADSDHWFARMLGGGCDYAQVHAAGDDDPPFRAETWHKANPSLPIMPDLLARIRKEAETAKADPNALASFRALRLNQGTSDVQRAELVSAEAWKRAEGEREVPRDGERIFGVDLGSTAAMSAVACTWLDSGRLEVMAAFPTIPSLAERGRRDGVESLYERMHAALDLVTVGERVVPVGPLIELAVERFGVPTVILCDRWRLGELQDALSALNLAVPLMPRGQGFRDGGEDVRDFRKGILDGSIRPARSILLRAAMREAVTLSDPAGNAKLAKGSEGSRRRKARDDAAAAAILAGAHAVRSKARLAANSGFWFEGMEA